MGENSGEIACFTLYTMIYVKLDKSYVYFGEECTEFENALYTLDWNLEKLVQITRPWKVLWRRDADVYKPGIIQEFFEVWKFEEQPEETYNRLSQSNLDIFQKAAQELLDYGIISRVSHEQKDYELVYNCDILNMFEDIYGPLGLQKIQDYIDLSDSSLNTIVKFYCGITKDKKLEIIRDAISSGLTTFDDISEFLPSWCCDSIKIFGIKKEDGGKRDVFVQPEYKNQVLLGYTDQVEIRKEMINEIYAEFKLGSVLRGSEIRTRFRKIYQKYGLNPKASLIDFMNYFVIRKAKSEYEWYYRIVRRKADEVSEKLINSK